MTLEKVTVGDPISKFDVIISKWVDDVTNLSISLRIDAGKTDRIRKNAWPHIASMSLSTDKLFKKMCPVSKLLHYWSI